MPIATTFSLTSYNIRKAIGRDGKRRPERIFDVLNQIGSDIVVLQEADFRFKGRQAIFSRSELLARTGLVAIDVAPDAPGLGWHGNMLMLRTKLQLTSVTPITLVGSEPRGAVISQIMIGKQQLTLIQTHLGLLPWQRKRQAQKLAAQVDLACPTVVVGDLNAAGPAPFSLSPFATQMRGLALGPTFPTRWPCVRFDRMYHTDHLKVSDASVHDTPLARQASDHLPITARFALA